MGSTQHYAVGSSGIAVWYLRIDYTCWICNVFPVVWTGFSSANVLPTARNNKKYIETHLEQAVDEMQQYIRQYPDFPVPAWYAHPVVLKRMIDIMQEGRATTIEKALEVLKSDLKALNSSVAVEQEEYDEVMAIKPMFLIREYQ